MIFSEYDEARLAKVGVNLVVPTDFFLCISNVLETCRAKRRMSMLEELEGKLRESLKEGFNQHAVDYFVITEHEGSRPYVLAECNISGYEDVDFSVYIGPRGNKVMAIYSAAIEGKIIDRQSVILN